MKKSISLLLIVIMFITIFHQEQPAKAHDLATGQHTGRCYCGEIHNHDDAVCGKEFSDCPVCEGTGEIISHRTQPRQSFATTKTCPGCGGTENYYAFSCATCGGSAGVLYGCSRCGQSDYRNQYCYVNCKTCEGNKVIPGTANKCTNGCVIHTHSDSTCKGQGKYTDARYSFNDFGYKLEIDSDGNGTIIPSDRNIIGSLPEQKTTGASSENKCFYCGSICTKYYPGGEWRIWCTGCEDGFISHWSIRNTAIYFCDYCNKIVPTKKQVDAAYTTDDNDNEYYYGYWHNNDDCDKDRYMCGKEEYIAYKGDSICYACNTLGYTVIPPCEKVGGGYYDTAGNLCSPVCDLTITDISFPQ